VLHEYDEHGRIHGGTREETIEAAFSRWLDARAAGQSVVAMAPDHATVDAFALRVRAMRSAMGEVEPTGIEVAGQVVGAGDEIVTTRNDRRLVTGNGHWVRNGDRWTVERRTSRGHLRVRSLEGRGRVWLPRTYVEEDVALAYAVTTHKAQGMTVDRGLLLADEATSDLSLYVGMTRGRDSNDVFVGADPGLDYGPGDDPPTPVEILQGVLRRDTAERSATEVLRDVLTDDESIESLLACLDRVEGHVISVAGPDPDQRRSWLDEHPDADRLRRDLQRRLDRVLFEPAIDLRTLDLPDLRRQPATPEPPSPEPDIGLSW
jgi:hypothetical protein